MRPLIFLFCLFSLCRALYSKDPEELYLTWLNDPTTTMTIQWHSTDPLEPTYIFYQKETDVMWKRIDTARCTPIAESPLLVYTLELKDLSPHTSYRFRIGDDLKNYTFRTLSNPEHTPLRFVVAGDAYLYLQRFRKMNEQIAKADPDFVVVGGDIAYTIGGREIFKSKARQIQRWRRFFREWKNQMVSPSGRLIPLLLVIGNHDISLPKKAPYHTQTLFDQLFALPKPGLTYRSFDIGTTLSLLLLDTGHHYPIQGAQTQWLEKTLAAKSHIPFKIPIYHVAAYPSAYKYKGITPTQIRTHWVPLFERSGVQMAFEHHNHTFKVTHKIRANRPDPTGILYLGDGAWGVSPRRSLKPSQTWYLSKSLSINHFWIITTRPTECLLEAFDIKGSLIDRQTVKSNQQL